MQENRFDFVVLVSGKQAISVPFVPCATMSPASRSRTEKRRGISVSSVAKGTNR